MNEWALRMKEWNGFKMNVTSEERSDDWVEWFLRGANEFVQRSETKWI